MRIFLMIPSGPQPKGSVPSLQGITPNRPAKQVLDVGRQKK
jgi:hypothetical protein